MYIGGSRIVTEGSNCFMDNMAKSEGGGIDIRDSIMKFNSKVFVANSVTSKGAAIHASFSTLIFQGSSFFVNNSAKYGGGIYSESSNLTFVHHGSSLLPSSENSFLNIAMRGGAQYFDAYSNFSLHETAQVHFQDNHATEFGGAIYVADVPGPGQFYSQQHVSPRNKCFFDILRLKQFINLNTTLLVFVDNTAGVRGSVLYGGLLDKCNFTSDSDTSALEFFNMSIIHSKEDTSHSISSDPTQLCFCNASEQNCRETTQSRNIYPGQQVAVSVVAIDQSCLAIPTVIHSSIRSSHNLTVSEIISYETESYCTSRNYSLKSKKLFHQLEFYPSNRSVNTIHLIVNITFEKCPIGFEQSNFTGECICDHRLWQ